MLIRFAYPLYETADLTAPPTAVQDAPPVETESISDHEAEFSPDAARQPVQADESERDDRGQFKPRHRAQSQRADADDVPAIAEQTKRIKDAEARLGADIVRKEGESERVFTLRRRAELLERQQATAPAVEPPKPPAPRPQPSRQAAEIPQTFPEYEVWVSDKPDTVTFNDYVDARADWRYAVQRANERASEAAETRQRSFQERSAKHLERVTAAKQKYADFDTVVTNDAAIGPTLVDAILGCADSAEVAYYLGKHPDIRAALNDENPGYVEAAVPALRRYLDALVASQRSTPPSSRTAAGSTGAAPAAVVPPAPRPPTPVRTGSIAAPDTPPGDDDMSIAAHEKHFLPRRR